MSGIWLGARYVRRYVFGLGGGSLLTSLGLLGLLFIKGFIMRLFVENVLLLGFWNVILIAFVLLLIHQGINHVLVIIEKLNGMKVGLHWYDVPISILFVFLFAYSIYSYKP